MALPVPGNFFTSEPHLPDVQRPPSAAANVIATRRQRSALPRGYNGASLQMPNSCKLQNRGSSAQNRERAVGGFRNLRHFLDAESPEDKKRTTRATTCAESGSSHTLCRVCTARRQSKLSPMTSHPTNSATESHTSANAPPHSLKFRCLKAHPCSAEIETLHFAVISPSHSAASSACVHMHFSFKPLCRHERAVPLIW